MRQADRRQTSPGDPLRAALHQVQGTGGAAPPGRPVTAIPWAFCGGGVLRLAAGQGAEWGVERLVPAGGAGVVMPALLPLAVVHSPGLALGPPSRPGHIGSVALA